MPNPNHASAVVEFALDMLKEIQEIKREFDNPEEVSASLCSMLIQVLKCFFFFPFYSGNCS